MQTTSSSRYPGPSLLPPPWSPATCTNAFSEEQTLRKILRNGLLKLCPYIYTSIPRSRYAFTDAVSMSDAQSSFGDVLGSVGCDSIDCLLTKNTTELLRAHSVHAAPVVDGVNLADFPKVRHALASQFPYEKRWCTVTGSGQTENETQQMLRFHTYRRCCAKEKSKTCRRSWAPHATSLRGSTQVGWRRMRTCQLKGSGAG